MARKNRRKHQSPTNVEKSPSGPRRPVTIGEWWRAAPHARVTRTELMRWAEGMTVMTKPDVIDMLREYERLRHWRRTKRFLDPSRSPIWQLIHRTLFEPKRDLADLTQEARDRVREQLDAVEAEASQPQQEAVTESPGEARAS